MCNKCCCCCKTIQKNDMLNFYANKNMELEKKYEELKNFKDEIVKKNIRLKQDKEGYVNRIEHLSRDLFNARHSIIQKDEEIRKLKEPKIISIPTQPRQCIPFEDVKLTFADYFLLAVTLILAIIGIVSICLWIFAR